MRVTLFCRAHVLHRADDVEYNAKLVHYFSFLAKRILISRFAM